MKCTKCLQDSNYKDRQASDSVCLRCRTRFAFEPKMGDKLTDMAFKAAIDRVSSNGTVRYSQAGLRHEVSRITLPDGIGIGRIVILVSGAGLALGAVKNAQFVVAVLLAAAVIAGVVVSFRYPRRPTSAEFEGMLGKWIAAHGTPAKMIVAPPPLPKELPARKLPAELATYSFDRAVICDKPAIVDLLLANNFHFENNCAVLSVTGYPANVFESVRNMLRSNPRIEVYALHDASYHGHGLARQLATSPEWFKGIGRVTDVGLLVRHGRKMRSAWQPATNVGGDGYADLSAAENRWLKQYEVELEAIRPEQIIKRLFRVMSQPSTHVVNDADGDFYLGGFFDTDANSSDGGDDSFG